MLTKSRIIERLKRFLYDAAEEKLTYTLLGLQEDQAKLVPESEVGFYYKSKSYIRYTNISPIHRHRVKPLHHTLHAPMDEYLTKVSALHTEWGYVSSYLQCVLNQCTTSGQLYWYLPIGLHGFIQSLGYEASTEEFSDIDIGNNQQGKELLITRLMLNMTGD